MFATVLPHVMQVFYYPRTALSVLSDGSLAVSRAFDDLKRAATSLVPGECTARVAPSTTGAEAVMTDSRIPVTLLSGFLGSGKTTLLEHILKNEGHGLKIAIIVNDMAEVNIDAALVANHRVSKKQEKIVQMQNGCICCTLRGDLLEEIAELARAKTFDYIIIESTGISEPQGVAESFTPEFAEMLQMDQSAHEEIQTQLAPEVMKLLDEGGLGTITRLDTLATVIDSFHFYEYLESAEMISEKYGRDNVAEEDERNISELLVEQIEFATRILVNKADMVSASTIERIRQLVKRLNPAAEVFTTVRCAIDPRHLVSTHSFDFDKAATSAGWLQSLKEVKKPETIEYGVTSFVYRRRRPFHPRRLYDLVTECFVLIEDSYDPTYAQMDEEAQKEMQVDGAAPGTPSEEGSDESMEGSDIYEDEKPDIEGKLRRKRESPLWRSLYRMKGFLWLCTRPDWYGELSCAGAMLTLGHGAEWFATMPEESWPFESPEAIADVRADFEGPHGDRRQEIVLIGEMLDEGALTTALDAALVRDDEWAIVEGVMAQKELSSRDKTEALQRIFDDGFEAWEPPESLVKEMTEKAGQAAERSTKGHHHGHGHHAHIHL